MSNVQQPPSTYVGSYPDTETMLQTSRQARNDPLKLNEYVMSDMRHPRLEAVLQSSQSARQSAVTPVLPLSPYPIFASPLENTPRDIVSAFGVASGGRMESPRDMQGPLGQDDKGSVAEISGGHGLAASIPGHRASFSSPTPAVHKNRTRSIDESSATSSTSSREPGARRSDEIAPYQDTGIDGSNGGYDVDAEHRESREQPPPWTDLKTKAGKERKRLPLACIACRRKKIRCSGEKPACKHCLRSRIPCVYKVTTRKAAPRTDYMAMLDKRLRRMEERVIKIIPKEEIGDISGIGRATVKPGPPGHPLKGTGSKKRAADEAFSAELDEWSNANSNTVLGPSSHPIKGQDLEEGGLLTEGAENLPSKDIQEHLAEVFFDCVYGQSYHLLHKPSFMRKLRAGSVPPVLILAVCAVSARFSTHPQVGFEPAFLRGECWAAPAREIALKRYDEPNITILTVLLILGLHEFGTCQGGRSWMLGGMAIRMAYALQLHRELDHDPFGCKNDKNVELSSTDREIRRRTMWACFLMDRFNSSGTERPTFASEENIDVQLPIKEAHFQLELPGSTERLSGDVSDPVLPDVGQISSPKDNMGVAAYMIRILALWGRVIRYLNLGGKEKDPHPLWSPDSYFTLLKTQAASFLTSLPTSLIFTPENLKNHAAERLANQFLFMHICYQQVILFMHRFAVPSTPGARSAKEMPKPFLAEAWNAAIDAADKISNLISEAEDHQVVAPFAGYCAFLSSTVHICGIFSKNVQLEASSKRNLASNVKYLSKMKRHWGMFHFMAENLKDIYRQHADAALQGSDTNRSNTHESGIFQYGDWFNKYPNGVSQTDYEDPAANIKKESGIDAVLSQKSDLQSVEAFFASKSPPSQAELRHKTVKKHSKNTTIVNPMQQSPQSNKDSKMDSQMPQQQPVLRLPPPNQTPGMSLSFPQPQVSQVFQQQHNFAPDYESSDLLTSHHQQSALPQLDRHLVYGVYTGLEPVSTTSASSTNVLSNGGNNNDAAWTDLDMSALTPGFLHGPTSAWFMPFNMEPPEITAEDSFVGGVNS
ncbi:MAG: hypothetical protein M1830_010661, partial [Pleopsidium flavum]